jgi:serine protease AprX
MKLSGTSMAAPMVTGAAALLLQKYPALTPDAVKATLMRTASKTFPSMTTYVDPATGISYTQRYDIFSVGAGYLDVWAALNCTKPVPANRRAGSLRAFLIPGTGVSVPMNFVLDGSNVIWGGDDDWGSTQVWGSTAFVSGTNVIWGGDDETWGDPAAAGGLLWAENVIWGGDETEFFSEALSALGGDK